MNYVRPDAFERKSPLKVIMTAVPLSNRWGVQCVVGDLRFTYPQIFAKREPAHQWACKLARECNAEVMR